MDTYLDRLAAVPGEFWAVLCEMAPYLLFGFLVAGLLSVFVKPETVEKHLGGRDLWSVAKAALFGVPLPLCSCGVIPVSASLRRHGASRGATASFLLATPQTSVDSIMVTFSLLGPIFAVFRPVAALLSAMLGGAVVLYLEPPGEGAAEQKELNCKAACCNAEHARGGKLSQILHYGFVELAGDIGAALLVGLVIAGLIAALVPDDFFAGLLGTGLLAKLVMMVIGLPVYVCATASVPVAAALILKGVSPGAALVFLMTGPATNAAAFTTVWKIMGRATAVTYLVTVAVISVVAGTILDFIYTARGAAASAAMGAMLPAPVKKAAGIALLLILAAAIVRQRRRGHEHGDREEHGGGAHIHTEETVKLTVTGMTCGHCVRTVERTLRESAGVREVRVDLKDGLAVVKGRELNAGELIQDVSELGYTVQVAR